MRSYLGNAGHTLHHIKWWLWSGKTSPLHLYLIYPWVIVKHDLPGELFRWVNSQEKLIWLISHNRGKAEHENNGVQETGRSYSRMMCVAGELIIRQNPTHPLFWFSLRNKPVQFLYCLRANGSDWYLLNHYWVLDAVLRISLVLFRPQTTLRGRRYYQPQC